MNVICSPAKLAGTVRAIPSKSDAHRKLICAALSQNGGVLPLHEPFCDDIAATVRCLKALGAGFLQKADGLHVSPVTQQAHADLTAAKAAQRCAFCCRSRCAFAATFP